jgi:hypothetical protein
MLQSEVNEGLPDVQTYIARFAWILADGPTATIHSDDVNGSLKHDLPGLLVRDDVFQILPRYFLVYVK